MDRDRDESRVCEDSKKKNFTTKHLRPTVISELAPIYIAGDGEIFINEEKAKNYQEKIMALHEKATKPTIEQVKKRVTNFLANGDTCDVTTWILEQPDLDIYNIMYQNIIDWSKERYRDEYDNLVEDGLIDEDELEEG